MCDRRMAPPSRLPAVGALLVLVSLLGQGCEKQRTRKPVEPAGAPTVIAKSAPAGEEADQPAAPLREEPQRTGPPATPRKADEPKGAPSEPVAENTEQPKPENEKRAPAAETVREKTQAPTAHDRHGLPRQRGVLTVTDANFAEITREGVALVDFWAERCPPCRVQGPIVKKLAERFAGRATIGKLDVDASANRRTPRMFRIMYIPTLVILRNGREVKRFVGLQSEAALASALEKALRTE